MAKKSSTESSKKKKNKSKNKIKSKLSILNSEAKKTKAPKENPFESIWSRRKFDILGKKRKDDERRRVGLSRSLAIQKRQKTLLKEYEQSTKSSVFVDKRIGEQNEGLGEFDKAILRSQRERQLKLKKKSKYNLSDGEEDEFEIQDSGYFPERDDFEDEEPLDEDEADQSVGSDKKLMLGRVNHHEAEPDLELRSAGEENAQKAKDKEENEQFIEQLDKDFASLVQSEALLSLTQPNKMRALKALVNNSISNDNAKKQETNIAQNKVPSQQEKPDHYDKLVGEMALDMRARPSDRTKAPEELAQEEKERLEQLEVFYGVLLQYFAVLANKKPLNFKLLNMLVKPLMEMSTEIPYFAAICARQRLLRTRTHFCEDVKLTGKSCWPSLKTLFLLRLWSMIFPCSDFRHAVMTPAILLMSEYLMRCPITSGRDIAIGSFLCSMVLSLYHLMELKTLRPLLSIQGRIEKMNSLDFLMLMDLPDDSPYFASDMFSFVKGRDYDPDRERAERKKLKKRLKQEAKGAVRELRKDNHFLLEVKERDKARMEEEKAEKYGKYRAFLQEQEHAFKSGQLGKGRKRRR
ncbi:UNVERIFIED_CONTAM: hypothetical protein Scaly_0934700 [Sesamum calycinum]|uniref:Nucleolar protein 14 n=1 Tax=Sesamum calycinum TaxID=2727403 RepID=A0AAW2QXL8_9LAMI